MKNDPAHMKIDPAGSEPAHIDTALAKIKGIVNIE
jgi:hypothetical protein